MVLVCAQRRLGLTSRGANEIPDKLRVNQSLGGNCVPDSPRIASSVRNAPSSRARLASGLTISNEMHFMTHSNCFHNRMKFGGFATIALVAAGTALATIGGGGGNLPGRMTGGGSII